MSIYTCPHCGEKTFNPLTKALAGQLNSKGKACPKCGKRCVNGKGATVFNAIYSLIVIICMGFIFLHSQEEGYDSLAQVEIPLMILLIVSLFVVPRLVNGFFFKMEQSIRIEL